MEIKEQIASFKKMINGYKLTYLILAAKEINIFNTLTETPISLESYAALLNIPTERIEPILNGLACYQLIAKNEAGYFLKNYQDILLKDSKFNQLGYIDLATSLVEKYQNLASTIKDSTIANNNFKHFTKNEAEKFMNGMDANALPQVDFLAKNYDFTNQTILDVGAGSGIYLITIANLDKTVTGKMIDLSEMVKIQKKKIEKYQLTTRISTEVGDYNQDLPSTPYDNIFLFAVIHQEPIENVEKLLKKVYQILNPQGRLFLTSFFLNEDKISPEFSVQFAIEMLVNSNQVRVYTHHEITALLKKAGFNDIVQNDDLPGPATLYIATK